MYLRTEHLTDNYHPESLYHAACYQYSMYTSIIARVYLLLLLSAWSFLGAGTTITGMLKPQNHATMHSNT
jgi:hypothetical protein